MGTPKYRYKVYTKDQIYMADIITSDIYEKIWHRDGEPAYIEYSQNGKIIQEIWYQNNLLHNSNGAAELKYTDSGIKEKYYLDDILYTKEQYIEEITYRKLSLL